MKSFQNCVRSDKFVSVRVSLRLSLNGVDSGAARASFDLRRRKEGKRNSKGNGNSNTVQGPGEKKIKADARPRHKTVQITSVNCDKTGHVKGVGL